MFAFNATYFVSAFLGIFVGQVLVATVREAARNYKANKANGFPKDFDIVWFDR